MEKVVHTVWFGKGMKPALERSCEKTIMEKLGKWERMEWNEELLPPMTPAQEKYLESALSGGFWSNGSNLLRVLLMKEEGGVYVDTDVEILKPFDEWVERMGESSTMVGWESPWFVNNAIILSEKGTWLWEDMARHFDGEKEMEFRFMVNGRNTRSVEKMDGQELSSRSGPWLFTDCLFRHGLEQKDGKNEEEIVGVRVVPDSVLYPLPFHARKMDPGKFVQEDSLAIHRWSGTWVHPDIR